MGLRVFVSVAEQSADEHAAGLAKAFQSRFRDAQFAGLAGPACQAAGCETLEDLTAGSAMAVAAVKRVPESLRLLGRLKDYFTREIFDAAVVVDSPALNLPIAKICRRAGIPVLYYIAPQTWAWGWKWYRNRRLRQRVNRVACIWPFEEQYFRAAGIDASFVGHPSFDRILANAIDEKVVAEFRSAGSPIIALLPGSRRHVVEEVFPGQLEVVRDVAARFRRARFLVVAASEEMLALVRELAERFGGRLPLKFLTGDEARGAAVRAADIALVASGTVTLEVAYHGTPMIVMYNTNRWTYQLVGRWLITTPHFSIPNILAGRRIVPEFMPYYLTTAPIIARAVEWLSTPATLERVRKDLKDAVMPIAKAGAAEKAAGILAEMVGRPGVRGESR